MANLKVVSVQQAVKLFMDLSIHDNLELTPQYINPFLRILEIMKQGCKIELKYDFYGSQENPKIYYIVTK